MASMVLRRFFFLAFKLAMNACRVGLLHNGQKAIGAYSPHPARVMRTRRGRGESCVRYFSAQFAPSQWTTVQAMR